MIEKVEFLISGKQENIIYDRNSFFDYLNTRKTKYQGTHYDVIKWINNNVEYKSIFNDGFPSYNWDCLIFRKNYKTLVICNPDGSVRFEIPVPDKLIQREEYDNHFKLSEWKSKEIDKDYYVMKYERFDDYFEFNGKHYLSVLLGKYNENENFDAYLQMRYLDCETGEFLPFTKKIIQRIPNPHSYTENRVEL